MAALEIGEEYRIELIDGWVEGLLIEIDNNTAILMCKDGEKRAYHSKRLKKLDV